METKTSINGSVPGICEMWFPEISKAREIAYYRILVEIELVKKKSS